MCKRKKIKFYSHNLFSVGVLEVSMECEYFKRTNKEGAVKAKMSYVSNNAVCLPIEI